MGWRTARSLDRLRDQVNDLYPARSTASDGTIGDAAHRATVSDHNPDGSGVVRALDLTHDPAHGLDAHQLAEQLVASRDDRIKYVISSGRIASSYPAHGHQPWAWRPYSGLNAHKSHVHVSVVDGKPGDSTRAWKITRPAAPQVRPAAPPRFPLPRGWFFGPLSGPVSSVSGYRHRLTTGARGHRGLQAWQRRMAARGWRINTNGLYTEQTGDVAAAFQSEKGLGVDRKIGPQTWAAAWTEQVTR